VTESRILPSHLERIAFVYVRQSTPAQVERNSESTRRQYALADRARQLGWPAARIEVIDEDLGLSGTSADLRRGFRHLAAEVALRHAGIVLGLEVSRLARNSADWFRLIDLCALTGTLIADADGIYDPAAFNDRLVLGLKGTLSEAELHTLKARLLEGIRNKAARGEFHCMLPVGFVWGPEDGQILFDPDEQVRCAVRNVFDRFAELGSVRRVWQWFLDQDLSFPSRSGKREFRWIPPVYTTFCKILANPVYAGAYVYGRTRCERFATPDGRIKYRLRRLPRDQWRVLLPGHHEGYIDWETFEANRERIRANRPAFRGPGAGSVRGGSALLQGLATGWQGGRRLPTHYRGRNARPNYHCPGPGMQHGRTASCQSIGGRSKATSRMAAESTMRLRSAACCGEQANHRRVGHIEDQSRQHAEQQDPDQQRRPCDPFGWGHVDYLIAVSELGFGCAHCRALQQPQQVSRSEHRAHSSHNHVSAERFNR